MKYYELSVTLYLSPEQAALAYGEIDPNKDIMVTVLDALHDFFSIDPDACGELGCPIPLASIKIDHFDEEE